MLKWFKYFSINVIFGFVFLILWLKYEDFSISKTRLRTKRTNTSYSKENACIFILCRESDLYRLKTAIIEFEERFNSKYNYDYVIVNNKVFSGEFKNEIQKLTDSTIKYGLIPESEWTYPWFIDQDAARIQRNRMYKLGMSYALSESYRFMCRYYSGFFFRHPLVQQYDYYWRIDAGDVHFTCDINVDPFRIMRENDYSYGYNIAVYEQNATIPTLWKETLEFMKYNPNLIIRDKKNSNSLNVITDASNNYNLCHFYNNFEIGSFKFFRSEKYLKYFEYLDSTGGFFYERWGDAPVHALAVAMFLPKNKIHFFETIGYKHDHIQYCPSEKANATNCNCATRRSYHVKTSVYQKIGHSCLQMWSDFYN